MPDWLDFRVRAEVSGWDVPPTRPRAALYRQKERSRRSGRLVLAFAVAVSAVSLGSLQAFALPGARVLQQVTRLGEQRPLTAPTAAPTPEPTAAPQPDEAAPVRPYIPPQPAQGVRIIGASPRPQPSAKPTPEHQDDHRDGDDHRWTGDD